MSRKNDNLEKKKNQSESEDYSLYIDSPLIKTGAVSGRMNNNYSSSMSAQTVPMSNKQNLKKSCTAFMRPLFVSS